MRKVVRFETRPRRRVRKRIPKQPPAKPRSRTRPLVVCLLILGAFYGIDWTTQAIAITVQAIIATVDALTPPEPAPRPAREPLPDPVRVAVTVIGGQAPVPEPSQITVTVRRDTMDPPQAVAMQTMFVLLGSDPLDLDGAFGPETREAVRKWPERYKFPGPDHLTPDEFLKLHVIVIQSVFNALDFRSLTVDGVAGKETREAVRSWGDTYGFPTVGPLSEEKIIQFPILAIQTALQTLGFGPLERDGINGAQTQEAVRKWQLKNRFPGTGQLTAGEFEALLRQHADTIEPAGGPPDEQKPDSPFIKPKGPDFFVGTNGNDPLDRENGGRSNRSNGSNDKPDGSSSGKADGDSSGKADRDSNDKSDNDQADDNQGNDPNDDKPDKDPADDKQR